MKISFFLIIKKKITLEAAQRCCKGCSRSGPIVKIYSSIHTREKIFPFNKHFLLKTFALDSAKRYTFSPLSETFELYLKMLSHIRAMYTICLLYTSDAADE